MSSVTDQITRAEAKGFDAQRKIYFPNAVAELLVFDGTVNDYVSSYTLGGNWLFDNEKYDLQIADNSMDVIAAIVDMTHFRLNGKVYIADAGKTYIGGTTAVHTIKCESHLRKSRFGSFY